MTVNDHASTTEEELIGSRRFNPSKSIKNILVTGGAGFIASWLVRHLVRTYPEYSVYCFDKLTYCSSLKNISSLERYSNFKFIRGDVTSRDQVDDLFSTYSIDTVLHLAAESHVDYSFSSPFHFIHTNVIGTQLILEACEKYKVKRLLHMSTDEVYGEAPTEGKDLRETSILAPTNPYAASKASCDMLVGAYVKSFKVPAIIVRCSNVYGPCQFPEKLIPKIITLFHRNEKFFLHGEGENRRRYLYVADAVNALDTILHKGEVGSIYNAGSDVERSNLEVCKQLLSFFQHDSTSPAILDRHIGYKSDRLYNDFRYAIDSAKIHKLGWKPQTDFQSGLEHTINWYLKHGNEWWGDLSQFVKP